MSLGATGIEVLGPLEANPTAIRWPFWYQVTGTSLTLAEPAVGFWDPTPSTTLGERAGGTLKRQTGPLRSLLQFFMAENLSRLRNCWSGIRGTSASLRDHAARQLSHQLWLDARVAGLALMRCTKPLALACITGAGATRGALDAGAMYVKTAAGSMRSTDCAGATAMAPCS